MLCGKYLLKKIVLAMLILFSLVVSFNPNENHKINLSLNSITEKNFQDPPEEEKYTSGFRPNSADTYNLSNPVGHWEKIQEGQYGFGVSKWVFDLDKDNNPEISIFKDQSGGMQSPYEAGYSEILEYNESTGHFSNELVSLPTTSTTYLIPPQPFNNASSYLMSNTRITDHLREYQWFEWDDGNLYSASDIWSSEDGLYDFTSFDFDHDSLNDLFAVFGYYDALWNRIEVNPDQSIGKNSTSIMRTDSGVFVADLNNDSVFELVVASYQGAVYVYSYNNQTDQFTQEFFEDAGTGPGYIYPWDYDRDGYPNILMIYGDTAESHKRIRSYEWNSQTLDYNQDRVDFSIMGITTSGIHTCRPVDLFGNGDQLYIFEAINETTGETEFGYLTYDGDFEYHTLYQASQPNVGWVALNIDEDPTLEIVISEENSTDGLVWNYILDFIPESSSYQDIIFDMQTDPFSSNGSAIFTKSSDSIEYNSQNSSIKWNSDSIGEDYLDIELPDGDWIIETQLETLNSLSSFTQPYLSFHDSLNSVLCNITFSIPGQGTGSWWNGINTGDARGPFAHHTEWDQRYSYVDGYLYFYAKNSYHANWDLIDTLYLGENPENLRISQPNDQGIGLNFLSVHYDSTLNEEYLLQNSRTYFLKEDFISDNIWLTTNWTRSGTYYSVDESNEWLHKSTAGTTEDSVDYDISLTYPFTVEYRGRLVSGGAGYTSVAFQFEFENGTEGNIRYATNLDKWYFNPFSQIISSIGPQSENTWWETKIIFTSETQTLYGRAESTDEWQLIYQWNNHLSSSVTSIGFHGSWDPIMDLDYAYIYSDSGVGPIYRNQTVDPLYLLTGDQVFDLDGDGYSEIVGTMLDSNYGYNSTMGMFVEQNGEYVLNHTFDIDLAFDLSYAIPLEGMFYHGQQMALIFSALPGYNYYVSLGYWDGSGFEECTNRISTGTWGIAMRETMCYDFDGDGIKEIVMASKNSVQDLLVLKWDGDSLLTIGWSSDNGDGGRIGGVCDIDNDDSPELVIFEGLPNNNIDIWNWNGGLDFSLLTSYDGSSLSSFWSWECQDVDGDGDNELIVAGGRYGPIQYSVFRWNSDHLELLDTMASDLPYDGSIIMIDINDYDSDGVFEIGLPGLNNITFYHWSETNGFSPRYYWNFPFSIPDPITDYTVWIRLMNVQATLDASPELMVHYRIHDDLLGNEYHIGNYLLDVFDTSVDCPDTPLWQTTNQTVNLGTMNIEWNSVSNVEYYEIYMNNRFNTSTPLTNLDIDLNHTGIYEFKVRAINDFGSSVQTAILKLTIDDPLDLLPIASFTANATTIIEGEWVQFTDTSTGGDQPLTYQWDFSDGSPNSTDTNPIHQYMTPNTYSAVCTVSDVDGDHSVYSLDITVNVDLLPSASFTPNTTTLIAGEWVQFTDTSTGGDQPLTYQWDFSDGSPNSTDTNPIHQYMTPNTYSAVCTVSDVDGDHSVYSLDITVNVDLLPSASFTPNTTTLIAGEWVQFTDTSTGGDLPLTYQWDFGDGSPNSTDTNPIHQYLTPNTYSAVCTVSDADGDHSVYSLDITVNVDLLPSASFTTNTTTLIAGEWVQFTDTSSGGDTPLSYQWDFGDGSPNSTETNPIHQYLTPSTYTTVCTVSDADGDQSVFSMAITVNTEYYLKEDFISDIIWSTTNWTRSGTYYSVDESNEWLHKSTAGTTEDSVDYDISLTYPFTVEYRGRLVSGGAGYTSVDFHFEFENGTECHLCYATNLDKWYFNPFSQIFSSIGPQSENTWWETKIIITSETQTLYGRAESTDAWQLIYQWNNLLTSQVSSIGFQGSWDPIMDLDYAYIYSDVGSHLLPSASFTANATTILEGDWVQFTDTSTGGDLPLTYQWDFGDGSPNSTDPNPLHQYMTMGSYTVVCMVTDHNGDQSISSKSLIVDSVINLTSSFEYYWEEAWTPPREDYTLAWNMVDNLQYFVILQGSNTESILNGTAAILDASYIGTSYPLGILPLGDYYFRVDAITAEDTIYSNILHIPSPNNMSDRGDITPPSITIFSHDGSDIQDEFDYHISAQAIEYISLISSLTLHYIYPTESWTSEQILSFPIINDNLANGTIIIDSSSFEEKDGLFFYLEATDIESNVVYSNITHTFSSVNEVRDSAYIVHIHHSTLIANFISNTTTLFSGEWIQFTDTSTGGNHPLTYQWDFGDGSPNSTDTNPIHQYMTPNTYSAVCTVSDADGNQSVFSMDITVNVNILPSASFTTNTTTLIAGEWVQFTDTSTGGDPPLTYEWNFGDGSPNSTETNPIHQYLTPNTYSTVCTVSDVNGDQSVYSLDITVNEDLLPSASFTANTTTIIEGDWVQFTDTSTGGNHPLIYQWDFGDGSPNSTDTNPTHQYSIDGTFTTICTVLDDDGDSSVHSVLITVIEDLFPLASFAANNTTITAGEWIQFMDTCTGGDLPLSYQWDFGDGSPNSTVSNPQHQYMVAGTFNVVCTVSDTDGDKNAYQMSILVLEPDDTSDDTSEDTSDDTSDDTSNQDNKTFLENLVENGIIIPIVAGVVGGSVSLLFRRFKKKRDKALTSSTKEIVKSASMNTYIQKLDQEFDSWDNPSNLRDKR